MTIYSALHHQEVCRRWAEGTKTEVEEIGGTDSVSNLVNGFDTKVEEGIADVVQTSNDRISAIHIATAAELQTFNANASTRTDAFDSNAVRRTNEFDWNFVDKKDEIDTAITTGVNTISTETEKQKTNIANQAAESMSAIESVESETIANVNQTTIAAMQSIEQNKTIVQDYVNEASIWAEGSDFEVEGFGGTKSAKGWADTAEEIVGGDFANKSLTNLNADGQTKIDNKEDKRARLTIYTTSTGANLELDVSKDYSITTVGNDMSFTLPYLAGNTGNRNYTATITAIIKSEVPCIFDWGTTKFFGNGIPTFTQGDALVVWDYNPLIEDWMCSVLAIGGY